MRFGYRLELIINMSTIKTPAEIVAKLKEERNFWFGTSVTIISESLCDKIKEIIEKGGDYVIYLFPESQKDKVSRAVNPCVFFQEYRLVKNSEIMEEIKVRFEEKGYRVDFFALDQNNKGDNVGLVILWKIPS